MGCWRLGDLHDDGGSERRLVYRVGIKYDMRSGLVLAVSWFMGMKGLGLSTTLTIQSPLTVVCCSGARVTR